MRTIFIGGPGRSGTSFVADRLANHSDVTAFRDVELKIFTEKNGLLDLWYSLIERYSPNRASVARLQFMRTVRALIAGQFGQPGFKTLAPQAAWDSVFADFLENISPAGEFERTTADHFRNACRQLMLDIASLSVSPGHSPEVFVEKTPHGLLALDFLSEIAPGAGFVHVMRDPRSIAQSLCSMRWGPDDLDDCCAWVSGYCDAWVDAQQTGTEFGLNITSLHIEKIAQQPEECASRLCDSIGITPNPNLFTGASLQILNGWSETAPREDLDLLNKRLSRWVQHFNYSFDSIGNQESAEIVGNETILSPDTSTVHAPSEPA